MVSAFCDGTHRAWLHVLHFGYFIYFSRFHCYLATIF